MMGDFADNLSRSYLSGGVRGGGGISSFDSVFICVYFWKLFF